MRIIKRAFARGVDDIILLRPLLRMLLRLLGRRLR